METVICQIGKGQVRTRDWFRNGKPYTSFLLVDENGKSGIIHHDKEKEWHFISKAKKRNENGRMITFRSFGHYSLHKKKMDNLWKYLKETDSKQIFKDLKVCLQNDDEDKAIDLYSHLLETHLDGEENIQEKLNYNYFIPKEDHNIGEGSWILIPDYKGESIITWAKPSPRKNFEYLLKVFEIGQELKTGDKEIDKGVNDTLEIKILRKKLQNEYSLLLNSFCKEIGCYPYQVNITVKTKNGKPKKDFVSPGEYFKIDDIQKYIDYVLEVSDDLKISTIVNRDMEDKIFYIQSRGIGRKMAEIMCNLKYTTFILPKDAKDLYSDNFKRKASINGW